jgi:predicted O-linked N-acetylglucosamine transferase (SPINDLY family)
VFRRGLTLAQQGKYDEAAANYQHTLRLRPNAANAHNNPGTVFLSRDRVLAKLGHQRIAQGRIEFIDRALRQEYLGLYHRIDLGLDPFPYKGHTTSLDAFWMGVPVVTLVGKTVVGRAGWSQLCNLGLQELAAETPDQYVALAAELAGDLPRLQELRATLRLRMEQSPLMDGKRFALNMEQAYRQK